MHFDDRLATVLRPRTDGPAVVRIQYRQLLDLLGTLPVEANSPQIDAAYDRLTELGGSLPVAQRAAMLRDPSMRLRNPRLIALLAGGEPALAAAAIARAQLNEDEWIDLAPALAPGTRGMVRQRVDLGPRAEALFDRLGMIRTGLPPAEAAVTAPDAQPVVPVEPVVAAPAAKPTGIGAIVQRIEDFRKSRAPADGQSPGEAPHLPFTDSVMTRPPPKIQAFDFATDTQGCVIWSDPGMAPSAIGLRLASREAASPASATAAIALALRQRQPVRALLLDIAGAPAIAGLWLIDAAPCFDPLSGGYTGHAGRMRRPQQAAPPVPAAVPDSETDRMRQLLHELRTPVNAIQGFSELIQQQLFGPVPHEYRALAASIAGDAAHMLAGFEELERLAQLESGKISLPEGECDLAEIAAATVEQLRPFSEPRSSGFLLRIEGDSALPVLLCQSDTERLIWRLLATLASCSSPGEVLKLRARRRGAVVKLSLQLPAGLAVLGQEELLRAVAGNGPRALSAGMFGTGFSLRLATAEALAAGGVLKRRDKTLLLRLPGLTTVEADHSEAVADRAAR